MKQRTEDVFEPVTSVEVPQGFEEFIAPHVESMRQEIRKRLVESDPDYPDEEYEEDAENALRVEVGFCQQVAAAYERWSQENEPLVLWDVDETLGMHTHTDEGYIFRFRPSLFFLVAHL
ncbi:hypothetical protein KKB83_03460, partial [Patescibacteria group bacterium]|nr:hypothetical protein [Patescibacteria group bacterium]